jgi:hypothetical protein
MICVKKQAPPSKHAPAQDSGVHLQPSAMAEEWNECPAKFVLAEGSLKTDKGLVLLKADCMDGDDLDEEHVWQHEHLPSVRVRVT